MAPTINNLYLKYVNKVGTALENDRYFQYLFEIVRAGSHTLEQKNQILHKVVDERWLSTIEDSLESINKIIEKPRRFVATHEEVVPVDLAKRITADSVRHLSMNTQYIASDPNSDDVYPTHIMTVSTEDSYDLYENRFIYHLIQRLVTFIDKRTDVIFWSTGDETKNTLKISSKVDDAYEQIEYKLEMSIKNNQSVMENDSDNMQVFMRIDRVRRLVMALRESSFCSLMSGCAKVRSPIQRTNLLMKDPDYRKCYKLWQFLESYDEVGYTIDVKESNLQFDEEYLIQMYTNLITNYTVFKSLLESDPRKFEEISSKQRKPIKPKFIKKIEEEIVDDRNIEEVEVRQVFIEEVTEAQLAAEKELAQQTERVKELEADLEDMDVQMQDTVQQLQSLSELASAANDRADEAEEENILLTQNITKLQSNFDEAQNSIKKAEKEIEELKALLQEAKHAEESAKKQMQDAVTDKEKFESEMLFAIKKSEESELARQDAEEKRLAAEEKMHVAEEARKAAEIAAAKSEEEKTRAAERASQAEKTCKSAQDECRSANEAKNMAQKEARDANAAKVKAENKANAESQARQAAEKAKAEALEKAKDAAAKMTEALSQAKDAQNARNLAEKEKDVAIRKANQAEEIKSKAEKEAALSRQAMSEAEKASKDAIAQAEEARREQAKAVEAQHLAEEAAIESRKALEIAEIARDKAIKRAERNSLLRGVFTRKKKDDDE